MKAKLKAKEDMLTELIRQMDEDEAKGYDMDEAMDGEEVSDSMEEASEGGDDEEMEERSGGAESDEEEEESLDDMLDAEESDDMGEMGEEPSFSDLVGSFMKDSPKGAPVEGAKVVRSVTIKPKKATKSKGKKSLKKAM